MGWGRERGGGGGGHGSQLVQHVNSVMNNTASSTDKGMRVWWDGGQKGKMAWSHNMSWTSWLLAPIKGYESSEGWGRWHGLSLCSRSTLSWTTRLLAPIKVWELRGMGERRGRWTTCGLSSKLNLWTVVNNFASCIDKCINRIGMQKADSSKLHNNLSFCFSRNLVVKLLHGIFTTLSWSIH